jgi:hypothetical protein
VVGEAQHPARTVVLEAPAQNPHAIRQQRAGDGVTVESLIAPAFEHECDRAVAVDPFVGQRRKAHAHRLNK